MRVLFTASPALGHMFPMIPLAWACRAQGHEVLVATAGPGLEAATGAGLITVDVAPDTDFGAIFGKNTGTVADREAEMRRRGQAIAELNATPDFVLERFCTVSAPLAARTLQIAQEWRPDAIVYSRLQGGGLLAARQLGVPAIEHGFGFSREESLPHRFLPHLAPLFQQYGVDLALPELRQLHVAPPSMTIEPRNTSVNVRYVPYNQGAVLPPELASRPGRKRIAVTLGTIVPQMLGLGSLGRMLAAAAGADAEFVLALGAADVGPLPPNVRSLGWVPLSALLPVCDGIIHHGGAGTTMSAACAGLPQVVLPHAADAFINAAAVDRRGVGIHLETGEVTAAVLESLLTDEDWRKAAAEVKAEVEELPAPSDVVPLLFGS
ncbi:MAG TPA: nucleotide disphospho-sugar-binding domain-containing protein [Streptosporangiaceae bacterium]|nr:nucleotide disphospho-sugar-binding domain-containing protein [Streptosporangiaceae bacterium]